jgi:hypothetical protein
VEGRLRWMRSMETRAKSYAMPRGHSRTCAREVKEHEGRYRRCAEEKGKIEGGVHPGQGVGRRLAAVALCRVTPGSDGLQRTLVLRGG